MAVLAVSAGACEESAPAGPSLTAIDPGEAYSDQATPVTVRGGAFLPGLRVDTRTGAQTIDSSQFNGRITAGTAVGVDLAEIQWLSTTALRAIVPTGLPPGLYDVQVQDPHGRSALLPRGFRSLGPDLDPPSLHIESPLPGDAVAPGGRVDVLVFATDPSPGALSEITFTASSPSLAAPVTETRTLIARPPQDSETFTFDAPQAPDGEIIDIVVTAGDTAAAPNRVQASARLPIRLPPLLAGLEPALGPTTGGTDVLVRGSRFIKGTRVMLDGLPLEPDGGVVLDEGTITARTPPHAAGVVDVTVVSPAGAGSTLAQAFTYREPPVVTAVSPDIGPTSGGTAVTVTGRFFTPDTSITIGPSLALSLPLAAQTLVDPTHIQGLTPRGLGSADVWAVDPLLGVSRLRRAFQYVAAVALVSIEPNEGPASGGTAVTVRGSGFQTATQILVGPAMQPLLSQAVKDANTIVGVMPAGIGTGDVVAVTPSLDTVTLAGAWTWRPAPTLTSVSPPYGPVAGGTTIVVKGDGFAGTVAVTFGGQPSPLVKLVDVHTVTASLPPGAPGVVPVAVTTAGGMAELPDAFAYRDAADALVHVRPALFVRGETLSLSVEGDRDPLGDPTPGGGNDTVTVRVTSSLETEMVTLTETATAGTYQGTVATAAGPAVAGDGVLQMPAAGPVAVSYTDGLRVAGGPVAVVATAMAATGQDGVIDVAPVAPTPGAALDVLVVDDDPRADNSIGPGNDQVSVTLTTSAGDVETLLLAESASLEGRFEASIPTAAGGPSSGNGIVEVLPGNTIVARYTDVLRADGSTAGVDVTATVTVVSGAPPPAPGSPPRGRGRRPLP